MLPFSRRADAAPAAALPRARKAGAAPPEPPPPQAPPCHNSPAHHPALPCPQRAAPPSASSSPAPARRSSRGLEPRASRRARAQCKRPRARARTRSGPTLFVHSAPPHVDPKLPPSHHHPLRWNPGLQIPCATNLLGWREASTQPPVTAKCANLAGRWDGMLGGWGLGDRAERRRRPARASHWLAAKGVGQHGQRAPEARGCGCCHAGREARAAAR